jgi:hypothetical protein
MWSIINAAEAIKPKQKNRNRRNKMSKQQFVQSEEFVQAVISATQAGFGGSGYSVEFFEDGSHRLLWNGQIGNLYQSPGEIIPVPQLSTEQVAECDEEAGEGMAEVVKFYRDELVEEFLREE